MDKRFIGILLVIMLAFTGFIFINNKESSAPSSSKDPSAMLSNHTKGNTDAKVTLVEYGDFQCPFCQQYEVTLQQVVETNKDKIKFQFRHFPLISLHKNAFAASRAAEAAALQGKFWEMHDLLYESSNWQIWSESGAPTTHFNQYAQQLSLDVEKFKSDFASSKVNDIVNADKKEGDRLGVTGTPTFFINGKKVQINNEPAEFQKVIDAELKKTKAN